MLPGMMQEKAQEEFGSAAALESGSGLQLAYRQMGLGSTQKMGGPHFSYNFSWMLVNDWSQVLCLGIKVGDKAFGHREKGSVYCIYV